MKRLVTILFVTVISLCLALTTYADGKEKSESKSINLRGQVLDKQTGETLAGVILKIENSEIEVTTDLDGQFEIKNLKPGEYKLVASYISYKDDCLVLDINENQNNITLELISR